MVLLVFFSEFYESRLVLCKHGFTCFFTVYYKHLHVTLRCIAILLAAFATVSIYRVSYFIIAAMAANVIHQALAPVALGMTRNTFFLLEI